MPPNDPCLSPGAFAVAPAALARMRRLASDPGEVHAIDWAYERSAPIPGDGWRDLGEDPFVSGERDAPSGMLWLDVDLVFDARRPARLDIGLNGALILT